MITAGVEVSASSLSNAVKKRLPHCVDVPVQRSEDVRGWWLDKCRVRHSEKGCFTSAVTGN